METSKNNEEFQNILALIIDKCRICLEHNGTFDIFASPNLAGDIFATTDVKVRQNDVFPKKICISCRKSIKIAVQLRKTALATSSRLKYVTNDHKQIKTTSSKENEIIKSSEKKHSSYLSKHKHYVKRKKIEEKNQIKMQINTTKNNTDRNKEKTTSISTKTSQSPQELSSSKVDTTITTLENSFFKKEYICQVCKKECPSRGSLYLHARKHNESRMQVCPVCEKTFTSKSDLAKHNRTHTGEKPFQCEKCNRSFAQNGTLKAHEKIHCKTVPVK